MPDDWTDRAFDWDTPSIIDVRLEDGTEMRVEVDKDEINVNEGPIVTLLTYDGREISVLDVDAWRPAKPVQQESSDGDEVSNDCAT